MSVAAYVPNGRFVHEDDLAAELAKSDTVLVRDLLDHLELVAQTPEAYGTGSAAARGALNLIKVMAEQLGWTNVDELGVLCR